MLVVMRLQKFEFETKLSNLPRLPITIETEMVGYLPVYDTKEDALKDFPGTELLEVKEVIK